MCPVNDLRKFVNYFCFWVMLTCLVFVLSEYYVPVLVACVVTNLYWGGVWGFAILWLRGGFSTCNFILVVGGVCYYLWPRFWIFRMKCPELGAFLNFENFATKLGPRDRYTWSDKCPKTTRIVYVLVETLQYDGRACTTGLFKNKNYTVSERFEFQKLDE